MLVAPIEHREPVVDDFELDEYLRLRRVVHATGAALTQLVPNTRLYIFASEASTSTGMSRLGALGLGRRTHARALAVAVAGFTLCNKEIQP